jgi:hypothetical protein
MSRSARKPHAPYPTNQSKSIKLRNQGVRSHACCAQAQIRRHDTGARNPKREPFPAARAGVARHSTGPQAIAMRISLETPHKNDCLCSHCSQQTIFRREPRRGVETFRGIYPYTYGINP